MSLTILYSERSAEHTPPAGHPERAERAEVMSRVAEAFAAAGGSVLRPRRASDAALCRVHTSRYVEQLASLAGRAVALDPDTYMSPGSEEAARFAAGAALDAVDLVLQRDGQCALAMVRPPGHHAESDKAMGFCLYNNVAVAAAHARASGVGRVAVVDYDVHHGNGTQHIFEADPTVLYASLHQYPFYPGTGAAAEVGRDDGRGFTVNLPMAAGAVNEDYHEVFSRTVVPVLRQFAPDLILVSAGFDAHERDPLGGMRLTTAAFLAMTMDLREVAEECCHGRLALVTEGGYDLAALEECLRSVVSALEGAPAKAQWPSGTSTSRGRSCVEGAVQALGRYWRLDGV